MSNFDRAFDLVVGIEGGYVNDPSDPGGETKFGISKRAHPDVDIPNLTVAAAKAIYLKDYWIPCLCDQMSAPVATALFDSAVNQGSHEAITLLQRALKVKEDGVLGPDTLRAVDIENPDDQVINFQAERALVYASTRNFDKFGRGWMRRAIRIGRLA